MAGITAFQSSFASRGVEDLGFNSSHRRDTEMFSPSILESQVNDLGFGAEKIEFVHVSSLLAGEISIDQNIRGGQTAYDTGVGFWLGRDGSTAKFSIGDSAGDKMTWDGATLAITGSFTATSGSIGGFDIGSDYIRDVANSFGLASTVTGGDDVRFWAGNTFANRATAPLRITEAGALVSTSATITGAITASSGSITGAFSVLAALTVGAAGTFSSGQTAYDTGVGWWMEYNAGTPRFSFGDSAGSKITFDGVTLSVPGPSTLGGFNVGSDYIRDVANSFGLASTVTGGDDVRFWAGDTFANRATAPVRITESGVVVATSATITGVINANTGYLGGATGWVIASETIKDVAGVVGMSSAVTGGDDIRFWAGDATPASAEFRVYESGALVATSATITGSITATSGDIGGWVVVSGYLYNLQSGTPTAAPNDGVVLASGNEAVIIYEDTEKRAEFGYLSAGVYGLKIYATNGSDVIFEASDTQQKVGGWTFTNTVLRSGATDAASNVLIDSANSLLRLGPTATDYITLDGANKRIRSSDYVSGAAGAGFTLEPDLLEVGNIAARGLIRTAVFQKSVISAVGGSFAVVDSDKLNADMTALDASTLTISGNTTFAVGDMLRIKDGTDDEWFEVTNVGAAPTYTVTRDKAAAYAANSNPAWKNGATVVNYGASGDGLVYMTASDTNAPYIQISTHAGSPWSTLTTRARLGNLNGYLGYVADIYGLGVGSNGAGEANITIEPTNGIRIRSGTTTIFQVDMSGGATLSGWTIDADEIKDAAGVVGMSSAVTGGDDIRFWAGDATPASAEFRVYESGALVASSATITGSITATSGAIGGFNIGSDYIRDAANSFGLASTVTGGDDVRFWAGDTFANRATAPFRVTEAGAVTATSITLSTNVVISGLQAGSSVDGQYLAALSVGTASIAALAVTDAKINDLAVSKLTAGTITSKSIVMAVADGTGDVEIRSGIATGDFANAGAASGFILGVDDSDANTVKFYIGSSTQYLKWDGTTLTVVGALSVSAGGTIGGFDIGSDYIRDVANTFGLASTVTGGDDVRFWAGDSFANRASAPFRITEAGVLFSSSGTVGGFTLSSTSLTNGTNIILDASNKAISLNDATFGNDGIQLQYNAGNPRMYVGDGADQFFKFDGTTGTANNSNLVFQDIFGDGSDGDVTISANTTLTTDMYYNNLTVNNGFTLTTANYRVFVKGTLTNNGTISNKGNAGSVGEAGSHSTSTNRAGGAGGAAIAAGFFAASEDGKAGANGTFNTDANPSAGTAGDSVASLAMGVAGAAGGGSNTPGDPNFRAGGAAGTVTAPTNKIRSLAELIVFRDYTSATPTKLNGSAGSGSGAGGQGGAYSGLPVNDAGEGGGGGGSGSPGGTMLLSASKIVNTGTITCVGGAGGNGGAGGDADPGDNGDSGGNGGGGGAGGSGGVMLLVYKVLTDSGTITVAGGAAGTGGAAGLKNAGGGSDGTAGDNASAGNAGVKIQIPV